MSGQENLGDTIDRQPVVFRNISRVARQLQAESESAFQSVLRGECTLLNCSEIIGSFEDGQLINLNTIVTCKIDDTSLVIKSK